MPELIELTLDLDRRVDAHLHESVRRRHEPHVSFNDRAHVAQRETFAARVIKEDAFDMGIALDSTLILLADDDTGEVELFRSFCKMACRGPFIIF